MIACALLSAGWTDLLPQPGGFEGSRLIVTEVLELDRLPVAERPQIPDMRLNLDSAPLPPSARADKGGTTLSSAWISSRGSHMRSKESTHAANQRRAAAPR